MNHPRDFFSRFERSIHLRNVLDSRLLWITVILRTAWNRKNILGNLLRTNYNVKNMRKKWIFDMDTKTLPNSTSSSHIVKFDKLFANLSNSTCYVKNLNNSIFLNILITPLSVSRWHDSWWRPRTHWSVYLEREKSIKKFGHFWFVRDWNLGDVSHACFSLQIKTSKSSAKLSTPINFSLD